MPKRILFRFFAILIGLLPFVFLEILCHLCGWGQPAFYDDPYVGFSSVNPLFVLNQEKDRYEIPPARLKFFCAESFPADKPEGQFRIFVLGGSTVQGRPYEIHTAFSTWLELSLKAAEPDRDWDVINCGGISYASYRLVPILEEVLQHDPDMIIICTGHNEILEERSYGHIKNAPAVLSWPVEQISGLRSYNLIRSGYLSLTNQNENPANRPELGPEVDAWLDFKGGMDAYHRDEEWRQKVIEHYEYNLRRMAHITTKAGLPLIFMSPVSNLDWPPFKSEHRNDLSPSEKETFEKLLEQYRKVPRSNSDLKIQLLEKAREIDDRYALVHYEIGQWYLATMRFPQAKVSLERAIEEDICPLRMLAKMRKIMINVAESTNTPLVNSHQFFTERSKYGITGDKWLLDHVHPTITGHKLLAKELFDIMVEQGHVQPQLGWDPIRDRYYQEQMKNLPPLYFPWGEKRLKGVIRWGFGKVKMERERQEK